VTNWFQNQRSLAKKRVDDDIAFEKSQYLNNHDHPVPDPSIDASSHTRDALPLEMPVLPPRSSHPSVSALIRREKRSPSAERSNGSTSSRGSPYHTIIPSHRPRRTRPEPYQLEALQKLYSRTANPSIEERNALALQVGMFVYLFHSSQFYPLIIFYFW
jgi:Homeodomain